MHRVVPGSIGKLCAEDKNTITTFMQDLAGREVTQEEMDFAAELSPIILPELRG